MEQTALSNDKCTKTVVSLNILDPARILEPTATTKELLKPDIGIMFLNKSSQISHCSEIQSASFLDSQATAMYIPLFSISMIPGLDKCFSTDQWEYFSIQGDILIPIQ